MTQTATTLAGLRNSSAPSAPAEMRAGFDTVGGFELMQRGAYLLANSTIVPVQYRSLIVKKDRYGNISKQEENPSAISNCVVALNMAQRMGADPLMIMQNLYIVEGRPAWSSQYIIASINACGKYSPLRFKIEDLGEKEVDYTETTWTNGQKNVNTKKIKVHDFKCIAWALEKNSSEVLESPPVTIELAVKEGWYSKNGSKWQTMPEVMLRYRAASFFGRLYAPELLMGIQTAEEVHDSTYDMELTRGGHYQVTTDEIRTIEPAVVHADQAATPAPLEAEATAPTKNAKAEMDALREETRNLWESTGCTLEEAEKFTGLYLKQWSRATCTKVEGEARRLAAKPAPAAHTAPSDASTIQCPRVDALIDEMECVQCHERDGCPSWE